MLVDCMFSQPYRSLIESQNCCLDNSNPKSVIGSTVNQFETPIRVDISTRPFSVSFISVINFSMKFLYFSSIDFFISVLSFFRLSTITFYSKHFCVNDVSSDFVGVNKFNFHCFIKYWNGQSTVPGGGRQISTLSLPLHMWHPVAAGINLFPIVLSRGSSKWRMFGMVLRKQLSLLLNPLPNAK